MKRLCLLWLLLLCVPLTSCRAIQRYRDEATAPEASADGMVTTAPAESDAAANSATTTTATIADTAAPTALPTDSSYKTVNYTLPVANPNKKLYDAPDGTYVGTFNSIGYYSVIREAKDSQGRTWGQLASGGGWTLVYFDVLPELEMWFGSGVGGWGTELSINGKGEFSGQYHDSDAGNVSDEHPNGSRYICDFSGSFAITDIGEYTVSLKMTALNIDTKKDMEWIEDGILYIPSSAHGLEGQTEFVLYTPDTPVDALPEDAYMWSPPEFDGSTIGCYALYGLDEGFTFFGE